MIAAARGRPATARRRPAAVHLDVEARRRDRPLSTWRQRAMALGAPATTARRAVERQHHVPATRVARPAPGRPAGTAAASTRSSSACAPASASWRIAERSTSPAALVRHGDLGRHRPVVRRRPPRRRAPPSRLRADAAGRARRSGHRSRRTRRGGCTARDPRSSSNRLRARAHPRDGLRPLQPPRDPGRRRRSDRRRVGRGEDEPLPALRLEGRAGAVLPPGARAALDLRLAARRGRAPRRDRGASACWPSSTCSASGSRSRTSRAARSSTSCSSSATATTASGRPPSSTCATSAPSCASSPPRPAPPTRRRSPTSGTSS